MTLTQVSTWFANARRRLKETKKGAGDGEGGASGTGLRGGGGADDYDDDDDDDGDELDDDKMDALPVGSCGYSDEGAETGEMMSDEDGSSCDGGRETTSRGHHTSGLQSERMITGEGLRYWHMSDNA